MLTEKRHELILELLSINGLVDISQLVDATDSSESTVRRDLSHLESINALQRIHGGAKSIDTTSKDLNYIEKSPKYILEKRAIGKLASSLINDGECIYIDAGTSTHELIEELSQKNIFVVTNSLKIIDTLLVKNIKCYILGGNIKETTKAVVGSLALKNLDNFIFDKCFLGTNGIDINFGFTTTDSEEAIVKECAIKNSKKSFILADSSKFNATSFVKFGNINQCTILTSKQANIHIYEKITQVKVADL